MINRIILEEHFGAYHVTVECNILMLAWCIIVVVMIQHTIRVCDEIDAKKGQERKAYY